MTLTDDNAIAAAATAGDNSRPMPSSRATASAVVLPSPVRAAGEHAVPVDGFAPCLQECMAD